MKLTYIKIKINNRLYDDPEDSEPTPPQKPSNYPDFDGTLEDKTPRVNT
jgi:hypothetical protein